MTERDDDLDEATRIVARANESLDEALRITGGEALPVADADHGLDRDDEETRVVDRPAGRAADPGLDHGFDETTRLVDRPAPAVPEEHEGVEESTRLVPRVDPLDESTHIVTRLDRDESTRLVTRPATRAERRAQADRAAEELDETTRIVARREPAAPEPPAPEPAAGLAARLASRAESVPSDGPVDDATQLAIRPPEPVVDPEPAERAPLPPKIGTFSATQTATFEQTGDERWPTGGAPRIAPLPGPAGVADPDTDAPRPRLIGDLPAHLHAPHWTREAELVLVDTAELQRETRAQRRRQAASVVAVIVVVAVGSAAGLAALLLTAF